MTTELKTKHTPGPWMATGSSIQVIVKDDVHTVACIVGPGISYAEGQANARLISVAPEMLEVLEGLLRECEMQNAGSLDMGLETAMNIAYDLIQKARGE